MSTAAAARALSMGAVGRSILGRLITQTFKKKIPLKVIHL